MYSLRHYAITLWLRLRLRARVPVPVVQRMADHKHLATTARYVHLLRGDLDEAAMRIGNMLATASPTPAALSFSTFSFEDFRGYLQADASSVYNMLKRGLPKDSDDGVKLLGCFAHTTDISSRQRSRHVSTWSLLASTRIILLTSGERPGDPTRFRELRIDAQLLKPIQQDELFETIYQVMSRSQGAAPPWARPTAPQAPLPLTTTIPLHILVAEDNELSAQVLEQTLARQGHSVRLASNGREVLTLAEQGGFDLLLLDVHMPELDGFQVVRAVREREVSTGAHLPIIAFTARSRKEDRERCLAAGMDDFQTKPIRPADLLAAIDRVLQTHSSRPYRRRDLPDAPMVLAFPPTQARQSCLLDHGAISRACGGRQVILEKLCEVFHRSLPDHMGSVHLALGERNPPRLAEAAHMLYGTLAAFSTIAGALAFSLEDLAKREDLESCAELVDRLESMCRELLEDTRALAGQVDGDDRATRVPARDAVAQPPPRLSVR